MAEITMLDANTIQITYFDKEEEEQRAERKELLLKLMENKIRQNKQTAEQFNEYISRASSSDLLDIGELIDITFKAIKTELLLYKSVKNPNSTKEIFDMLLVKYQNISHKDIEMKTELVDKGLLKEGNYMNYCNIIKRNLEEFEKICYTAIELL